ncbi:MAG: hypothetical protein JO257_19745 [Deltaproteobacteria bacterium]|nr:hypothetical protein [Deltaproteobacteria bacterium]
MIAELCGLAIDARAMSRTRDLPALANASRWIAANALAISRRPITPRLPPYQPRVCEEHIADFGDLLAALAAAPALVDPATLPASWRLGLQAIGVPVLDRPVAAALSAGVSVLRVAA